GSGSTKTIFGFTLSHLNKNYIIIVDERKKQKHPRRYGDIMRVETSGASNLTAGADRLTGSGVQASEKMANHDLACMRTYKTIIGKVASKRDVDPALIAAIASRESRGGAAISGNNGWCPRRIGFGLMQVDKDAHTPIGAWNSVEHVDQATGILVDIIKEVQRDFPDWSREKQLKAPLTYILPKLCPLCFTSGAIAYYNMGRNVLSCPHGVDHLTTGKDYSSDVVARAQFYKRNGF
uniref:Lysozyme g n=1 Tax=Gadus morhua TaxID=8049 RepID=A0A8C4Z743_GADMO